MTMDTSLNTGKKHKKNECERKSFKTKLILSFIFEIKIRRTLSYQSYTCYTQKREKLQNKPDLTSLTGLCHDTRAGL